MLYNEELEKKSFLRKAKKWVLGAGLLGAMSLSAAVIGVKAYKPQKILSDNPEGYALTNGFFSNSTLINGTDVDGDGIPDLTSTINLNATGYFSSDGLERIKFWYNITFSDEIAENGNITKLWGIYPQINLFLGIGDSNFFTEGHTKLIYDMEKPLIQHAVHDGENMTSYIGEFSWDLRVPFGQGLSAEIYALGRVLDEYGKLTKFVHMAKTPLPLDIGDVEGPGYPTPQRWEKYNTSQTIELSLDEDNNNIPDVNSTIKLNIKPLFTDKALAHVGLEALLDIKDSIPQDSTAREWNIAYSYAMLGVDITDKAGYVLEAHRKLIYNPNQFLLEHKTKGSKDVHSTNFNWDLNILLPLNKNKHKIIAFVYADGVGWVSQTEGGYFYNLAEKEIPITFHGGYEPSTGTSEPSLPNNTSGTSASTKDDTGGFIPGLGFFGLIGGLGIGSITYKKKRRRLL